MMLICCRYGRVTLTTAKKYGIDNNMEVGKLTIAEFIKDYRKKYGLTQRDFARMLDVSDMTVSRIEAGQPYLSTKVLTSLAEIISPTDIQLLSTDDPQIEKLKRVYVERHPDFDQTSLLETPSQMTDFQRSGQLGSQITTFLKSHNFDAVYPDDGLILGTLHVYNAVLKKSWVIFSDYHSIDNEKIIFNDLPIYLSALGYTYLISGTNVKKVSVITGASPNDTFLEKILSYQTYALPCDFSIIFAHSNGSLYREMDLSIFGDGRGLFDFASPDETIRYQAIDSFTRWKRSLL